MIRCSEEFRRQDWTEIKDPTYRRLMMMGIFDWDKDVDRQLQQFSLNMARRDFTIIAQSMHKTSFSIGNR